MPIKAMFIDIGGVLLTDGWNRHIRKAAAKKFGLDLREMEDRHHINVELYETGKLSLKDYLSRVVFYRERTFSRNQFWTFMTEQSKPFPQMIEMICRVKARHALKVAVVSNEARELNAFRIRQFKLGSFVDFFICSSLVHLRKPDIEMFQMALDVAQVPARQIVYIENTPLFVQLAGGLGIQSILHTDYQSTYNKLAAFGLDQGSQD